MRRVLIELLSQCRAVGRSRPNCLSGALSKSHFDRGREIAAAIGCRDHPFDLSEVKKRGGLKGHGQRIIRGHDCLAG